MRENICRFIVLLGIILMMAIYHWEIKNKEEQITALNQALTEQIQEVEVYRGILEEYQTEGIINE